MSSDEYLSTEAVCGKLAQAGIDEATIGRVFSARLQPLKLADPDKKFCLGVPAPNGQAYLVVYRFWQDPTEIDAFAEAVPEAEEWIPRWLSVEGPFTRDEADDKAKELTADA